MKYSLSLSLLVLLSYVVFFVAPFVHGADVPRLTLQSNHFDVDEPINILYEGAPTMLSAQLIDHLDTQIKYKAVLKERNGKTVMEFITQEPLKPGKYALKVWKDNDKLVDTFVYWGVDEPAAPSTKTDNSKITINREAPTSIEAEKTYTVKLSFEADRDYQGTLTDLVPFDAIVDATGAAQVRKPELLALRMPFDDDYEVTDGFGIVDPDEHLGIGIHDGTDFATPMNTPIFAVDDGEIIPYREVNEYGITQAVLHSWGTTFYGHLNSTPSAQIGDKVVKGQQIGLSGNTGKSTGPHLHFGMKWGDEFVDGLPYIKNVEGSYTDQKLLSWDIDVKKGEKIVKSYMFTMPKEATWEARIALGPAATKDLPEFFEIHEEKPWNLNVTIASPSATR